MNNLSEEFSIPVIGFAAFSGTGKTTLLKELIHTLSKTMNVGLIKQSHHDIDIDIPGKDSYELRKAGASQTLITSPYRLALIKEFKERPEPDLSNMINQLDLNELDIVFVEGFKQERFTKIELHRKDLGKPLLYPDDKNIIAIATDDKLSSHSITTLDLNKPDEILNYICSHFL
ncbi:MAG: molybdopterin-guanine dinucleotide biosynthesis protein B [Gammaproteobacteria bacterium]|nr:molybdopterin-guanine dinucleotide biosynthesis protein B [Gammaproteobacteria bacterium]